VRCKTTIKLKLLNYVLRENRFELAPGAKTALDQSAAAIKPDFLFHEGADFRFAAAHRL
jgi:hypothetical protein